MNRFLMFSVGPTPSRVTDSVTSWKITTTELKFLSQQQQNRKKTIERERKVNWVSLTFSWCSLSSFRNNEKQKESINRVNYSAPEKNCFDSHRERERYPNKYSVDMCNAQRPRYVLDDANIITTNGENQSQNSCKDYVKCFLFNANDVAYIEWMETMGTYVE